MAFYKGQDVRKDLMKAKEYFQKAADQGNIQAEYNLAMIYHNGIGIDKDLVKATQLYKTMADQGHPPAQYNLAICLQGPAGDQNAEDARKWLQKAVDQGFAPAQIELAKFYRFGLGGEENLYEAWNLYEKLVKKGHKQFSQIIEDLYQDIIQQYEDIIAQENADIQYKLGLVFNNKWSGHQDLEKATNLFRKAAHQGYAAAQYYLGLSYHYTPDNQKDLSKALYWYLKAAQEQHLEPVMARRVKNYS